MTAQARGMIGIPLADHRSPRDAFERLIAPSSPVRILLLHGPMQGAGKTRLLDHCFAKLAAGVDYVRIDLKDPPHPADELLQVAWLKMGDSLARLAQARRDQASPLVQVMNNRMIGMNTISVEYSPDAETDRARLVEAFFEDALAFKRPFLIAIDSHDYGSKAAKDWIKGLLLPVLRC